VGCLKTYRNLAVLGETLRLFECLMVKWTIGKKRRESFMII
jgi:hypothetical protein